MFAIGFFAGAGTVFVLGIVLWFAIEWHNMPPPRRPEPRPLPAATARRLRRQRLQVVRPPWMGPPARDNFDPDPEEPR